jgi:hypothetical protein
MKITLLGMIAIVGIGVMAFFVLLAVEDGWKNVVPQS